MLEPDVARRIRTIFLHAGGPVTIFDFIILLEWSISSFEDAVKWRIVTLEDGPSAVPMVSHAQLVFHAREQWTDAEIGEALGEDAPAVLAALDGLPVVRRSPLPASVTPSVVRDALPVPPSVAPSGRSATRRRRGSVWTRKPAAADPVDANRGVYVVDWAELFPPVPHVPTEAPSPAQRRRELREIRRREAANAEAPLPPARRRRPDGIREATFTSLLTAYRKVVPFLRLSGHWLAAHGFTPRTRVYITVEAGKLIITAADPAAAVRSAASAPAAVAPIARRARGTRRAAAAAAAR
jgi:hypothetical protein